jgi:hypothetical protein
MRRSFTLILILIIAAALGLTIGMIEYANSQKKVDVPNNTNISSDTNPTTPKQSNEIITPVVVKEPIKVKGVYATGWAIGTKSIREAMIKNINETDFNAIIIDIKVERGQLSYNSNVPTALEISASKNMVKDISAVVQEFKDNDIYVIGRIVTFKDPTFASKKQEIAYKKADGSLWLDYDDKAWPNPYNTASWEYPLALAKEAAELGFDEIQFDYIRFPSSEGRIKEIAYGFNSANVPKADIIENFLREAMKELKPLGVTVSGDVFGITTRGNGDFENIGQDFLEISKILDVVCPMVYPSHYARGEYGIAKPDLEPYNIVYKSLKDAIIKIDSIPEEEHVAIIRPYLQDFSATWLKKGNYLNYGTKQVKDQIQATVDVGLEEFILWDPNNKYAFDALEQVKEKTTEPDSIQSETEETNTAETETRPE